MEFSKEQSIIEAMLFAAGREVSVKEIMNVLELGAEDIDKIILNMKTEYEARNSGFELIKVNDSYQLCTRKEYYEYIYPLFDNRAKPNISNAALETLSIIAYNPNITRAEIEAIRGVNADGTVYKLLEFGLIEIAGKLDAPGRPMMYKTTDEFLDYFGLSTKEELPKIELLNENSGEEKDLFKSTYKDKLEE